MPAFLFLAHCARLKKSMRVEGSKCATFAQNHSILTHCPWTSSCGSCPPPPRARKGKALPGPHPSWTPVIRSNPLANTSRHVEFFHIRLLHVALGVADSAAIAPAAVVPLSASDGVSVGVVLAVVVVVVSSSCCQFCCCCCGSCENSCLFCSQDTQDSD